MSPTPPLVVEATRAFLRQHPPFNRMTDAALDFAIARMSLAYFAKDAPIVGPDTGPVTHLHVVQRGLVATWATDPSQNREPTLGPGECFPVGALSAGGAASKRYTAVQDAGKAVYPDYVASQIQGGAVQGIGWALNEEYVYDALGRLANANWLDYRMPVSLDLPAIEAVIVEVPSPGHPFGVRGVGEVPIVPPAAAVANAIYAAIGVRLTELPMSPGRIVAALQAR